MWVVKILRLQEISFRQQNGLKGVALKLFSHSVLLFNSSTLQAETTEMHTECKDKLTLFLKTTKLHWRHEYGGYKKGWVPKEISGKFWLVEWCNHFNNHRCKTVLKCAVHYMKAHKSWALPFVHLSKTNYNLSLLWFKSISELCHTLKVWLKSTFCVRACSWEKY